MVNEQKCLISMKAVLNPSDITLQAVQNNLYFELIVQLNKDLALSSIQKEFKNDIFPEFLVEELVGCLIDLINNSFQDYLNLLYRVDVSENEVRKLAGLTQEDLAISVAYLILKREWRKVFFRNKYS
jgi:hypothetical protein